MNIVFTQFTPPFEHGMTESEYLAYHDWYAELRRKTADHHKVAFVSLTKKKKIIEIERHGYKSYFFPVENPESRQKDGRLFYESNAIVPWLDEWGSDVIHIVGTGSEMGLRILKEVKKTVRILWERCAVTKKKLQWEELQYCDYYVHPTKESLEMAAEAVSREKLITVPLGADTRFFRPLHLKKDFDIVTVGRLTPSKQIGQVQQLVKKKGYTWIHAGGIVKGDPYTCLDNIIFAGTLGKLFKKYPIKKSISRKMLSGYFKHSDMPTVYNRARIMVHPSAGEGAARAVQEALCCGIPVVALKSTVPFIEKEFGMAVSLISEMESAVEFLLGDEKRRQTLGENGRKWIETYHSSQHLWQAVEKLHQMAASRRAYAR